MKKVLFILFFTVFSNVLQSCVKQESLDEAQNPVQNYEYSDDDWGGNTGTTGGGN